MFVQLFMIRKIRLANEFLDCNCTCPTWFCKRYCHHVLALLYQKKILQIPADLPIGRQKGAKKKIKGVKAKAKEKKQEEIEKKTRKQQSIDDGKSEEEDCLPVKIQKKIKIK